MSLGKRGDCGSTSPRSRDELAQLRSAPDAHSPLFACEKPSASDCLEAADTALEAGLAAQRRVVDQAQAIGEKHQQQREIEFCNTFKPSRPNRPKALRFDNREQLNSKRGCQGVTVTRS